MLNEEDAWVEHVNDVSTVSLRSTCSSWYVGTNIPGRPCVHAHIGGFPVDAELYEVMTNGFNGFAMEGGHKTNAAPQVRFTERWRVPLDVEVISAGGNCRKTGADGLRRIPVRDPQIDKLQCNSLSRIS